jgi:uncharacterized delta-60 repeat protein
VSLARQADGRIIVGGRFILANGVLRNGLARFNADGTLDASYSPLPSGVSPSIESIALQPDGKAIVFGDFSGISGVTRSGSARLNADGSLDASFLREANVSPSEFIFQPDGKILLAGTFSSIGGQPRQGLARLNSDGTLDTSFNPVLTDPSFTVTRGIALQKDGKIIVVGRFSAVNGTPRNSIARLNRDGSVDTAFEPGGNSILIEGVVREVELQMDDKILLSGIFSGGVRLARLNSDGARDNSFVSNATVAMDRFTIQSNGDIVGFNNANLFRYRGNGTLVSSATSNVIAMVSLPNGKLITAALSPSFLRQYNTDLSQDTIFPADIVSRVLAIARQSDGKLLVGGDFLNVDLTSRTRLARLHQNGELDLDFAPSANNRVLSLAQLANQQLLVGGTFTELSNQPRIGMARLNADGGVDLSYTPNLNDYASVFVEQPDGKVLVGGNFTQIASSPRLRIARLNPNGNVDSSFSASASANAPVLSIALQQNGKVVIAGDFTVVNNQPRNRIARLNADGSLDTSYNPNANGVVRTLVLQPNGKLIVAGSFTNIAGQALNRIARLNEDGSRDVLFENNINGDVFSIALQADESLFVGGSFTQVNQFATPINNFARLLEDAVDVSYNPGTDGTVFALALGEEGRPILGGSFGTVAGGNRGSLASLVGASAALSELVITGNVIEWRRSGSSPELSQPPQLLSSPDGANYSPLGTMQRVSGGWRFIGVAVPVGQMRWFKAQAPLSSGQQNASAGRIEQAQVFFISNEIFANGFE